MLHQPRVPPTGQRQAVEIQIKWKEVLAQKQAMLDILAKTTGHTVEKLDKVTVLCPICTLPSPKCGIICCPSRISTIDHLPVLAACEAAVHDVRGGDPQG